MLDDAAREVVARQLEDLARRVREGPVVEVVVDAEQDEHGPRWESVEVVFTADVAMFGPAADGPPFAAELVVDQPPHEDVALRDPGEPERGGEARD